MSVNFRCDLLSGGTVWDGGSALGGGELYIAPET